MGIYLYKEIMVSLSLSVTGRIPILFGVRLKPSAVILSVLKATDEHSQDMAQWVWVDG